MENREAKHQETSEGVISRGAVDGESGKELFLDVLLFDSTDTRDTHRSGTERMRIPILSHNPVRQERTEEPADGKRQTLLGAAGNFNTGLSWRKCYVRRSR